MPICAMWRRTGAYNMKLTRVEREKITDSMLKIQSVKASLDGIDESKVQELDEIQDCLETADDNLRQALRSAPPAKE
jgi:hypothetical protein